MKKTTFLKDHKRRVKKTKEASRKRTKEIEILKKMGIPKDNLDRIETNTLFAIPKILKEIDSLVDEGILTREEAEKDKEHWLESMGTNFSKYKSKKK